MKFYYNISALALLVFLIAHSIEVKKQILNLAQAVRFVPIVPLDLQETERLIKQAKQFSSK